MLDGDGEFTVRSTYRQIHGEQTCEDRKFWWRLWRIKLPGKMLNLLWRACINVLPTKTALASKNVDVVKTCAWCHVYNEDAVHALFTCCFAREMWNLVGLQRVVPIEEGGTVLQTLKEAFNNSSTEQCVQITLLCWSLWIRRNTWIWDRKAISTFGVNAMAMNCFQDWKKAQEDGTGSKERTQLQQWCKPPPGWIKINIDASCRVDYDFIGAGCVARDEKGCFVRARTCRIGGRMQAKEGEARSLREALIWIRSWRKSKCIFEMDAKAVVEVIHVGRGNSIFHTIVDDCVEILKHFEEVLVVFTRTANKVAHLLAQATYSMPVPME